MLNPLDRLYFGWRVHAGVFISALLAAGCTSYIYGLFVVPVTEEFNLSRANMNLGYTAFLLGFGLLSPIVGRLMDKYSARLMLAIGGVMFGIGFVVISQTSSLLLMLLMILGPISFAMNASGTLAATTLVSRWFQRRRGKALGIVTVSTSVGGFIFIPFTAMLIENFGWRGALFQLGIIMTVVTLLVALFLVRNKPSGEEKGYDEEFAVVKEDSGKPAGPAPAVEREWRYEELFRNRNFWLLVLGVGLLYGSDLAMVTSQVPHFIDSGIELSAAAMIASFMTISAIGGKLLVGFLADRIDLRLIFLVIAIAHAILLILYMVMPPYYALLAMATLMGIGVGGVWPMWATLIAWLFGSRSFATIMGATTVMMNLMGIIALRFIGEVHDRTGSYYMGFVVFLVAVFFSIAAISFLKPPSAKPVADSEDTRYPGRAVEAAD